MRGRKPTPNHLKLVRGNPGRRPIKDTDPKVEPRMPTPPPELSADALEEWHRLTKLMLPAGLLTELDRGPLAAYCQAYGRWLQAERAVAEAGLLAGWGKNGMPHPMIGIASRANADMVRWAIEFGFTPSSRGRIKVEKPEKRDPNDDFFAS